MFNRLQQKWKVTGLQVVLILCTFAIGGSLTGYVGRKLMNLLDIGPQWLWIIVYILLVTLLWPVAVLLVSVPFGQFKFFTGYLKKIGKRMGMFKSRRITGSGEPESSRESGAGSQESGVGSRESGAGSQESGVGSRESGVGSQESGVGSQESGVGSRESGAGSRESGAGSRESAGGSQESGVGSREPAVVKRIAIFASGAGSNARKIIDHFREKDGVKIALIVCNKPEAGVLRIAETEGIPALLIEKERFFRGDAYVSALKQQNIDLVVLAGFLWKIPVALIQAYPGKIVNIHPALLPKYGGKGMYGQFVHAAVIAAGEKESGITIHFVDEHYDHGDIIFQATCPVLPEDTPETLAKKIHELEHAHFPVVIEELIERMA